MNLALYEEYGGQIIYRNLKNFWYVVYDDKGDKMTREAVRLFVQNNIDINLALFSYHNSEFYVKNTIDIQNIVTKSEESYGMSTWPVTLAIC